MSMHARIHKFIEDVAKEVMRAQAKFPDSYGAMCALTEEVGELAKAAMDEPYDHVYREAVQVAAMAARIACEGDPSLDCIRKNRKAGPRERSCPYVGCSNPWLHRPPCALCYE